MAIVDTGVDVNHPNLKGAFGCTSILDFSSHLFGTRYDPPPRSNATSDSKEGKADGEREEKVASGHSPVSASEIGNQFKVANQESLSDRLAELNVSPGPELDKIVHDLEDAGNQARSLPLRDPSTFFAAHGTACAGLVGGRVGKADGSSTKTIEKAIPYSGVNPFCKILPVCTPYSHEILPVIHALLYAVLQKADVILMPRGINHPQDRALLPGLDAIGTRIEQWTEPADCEDDFAFGLVEEDQANLVRLKEHQAALEDLITQLSRSMYIVLAAGNDGFKSRLSYPASLIGEPRVGQLENTVDRPSVGCGLIVVAAVNSNGSSSAYSNGNDIPEVLQILSDDSVAVQEDIFRIDKTTQFALDYDFDAHYPKGYPNKQSGDSQNEHSPWGILSLDVSGEYGHHAGHSRADPKFATTMIATLFIRSLVARRRHHPLRRG